MSDEGGDAGSYSASERDRSPCQSSRSRSSSCSSSSSSRSGSGSEEGHEEGHGKTHKSKNKTIKSSRTQKETVSQPTGTPNHLPDTTQQIKPAFHDTVVPLPECKNDPPPFAPYEAEYEDDGNEIVSHDPHLNEDGEALYRFLLSQTSERPDCAFSIEGTHHETRTRTVRYTDSNGDSRTRTENYTVTVIDFRFGISVADVLAHAEPIMWTVPDMQATYRGTMHKEVDETGVIGDIEKSLLVRRRATDEEEDAAKAWRAERMDRGIPPWIGQYDLDSDETPSVLKSSRTIRDWADDYCKSDRVLKEFVFKKEVYGWNVDALKQAILHTIRSTGYQTTVGIDFNVSRDTVIIRSANRFSRMLDNIWILILLWIFLIYPFIWLWKRYSPHGGAEWKVCGAAYALKATQPPAAEGAEPTVLGEKEGVWFQKWEKTIKACVSTKRRDGETLTEPYQTSDFVPLAVAQLDGYTEAAEAAAQK